MNSFPTQQDIVLSKKYNLLPNFFYFFHSQHSSQNYSLSVSHENILQSPSYSYHLCRCNDVMTKTAMFLCGSCGSSQCWKHFLPWNQDNNSPDLYLTSMFAEYLLTKFPDASFISTRALLFYDQWSRAETSSERENIALQSLQEDGIHCSNCGLDSTVTAIHFLLFPMSDIDPSPSSAAVAAVCATPRSSLVLLPPDTELVQIHLIDRDKFRFEEIQSSSSLLSMSGSHASGSLLGSVCAEPSALLMPELDVTIQSDWNYLIFRAVLLASLFEDDLPTMSSGTLDFATIPTKYFRESDWDDYGVYLIESDELSLREGKQEEDSEDLMIGGWKWATHLVSDLSKIAETSATSTGRGRDKGHILVHQLLQGDIITVRSHRDNIGPPSRLSLLSALYHGNIHLQYKARELGLFYSGWRQIRGDGNCYYRAVVFGYLESIIALTYEGMTSCTSLSADSYHLKQIAMRKRKESFGHFLDILESVKGCYCYEHEQEQHERLMWAVSRAAEGEKWISLTEFENDILNAYTRLDQSAIRAIRYAAGLYLKQHQDDDLHGITLKEAILPSYPNCR
jgi:hypothetical protein